MEFITLKTVLILLALPIFSYTLGFLLLTSVTGKETPEELKAKFEPWLRGIGSLLLVMAACVSIIVFGANPITIGIFVVTALVSIVSSAVR